jgi:predicted enzyme related to lactoylglutathione lyase
LCSSDPGRSVAFYEAVGGFERETMKMKASGGGPDRYEILKSDGKRRAGIMSLAGTPPYWMPYVKVANTDATVAKAKKLGAEVKSVETVPSIGRLAVFIDPRGAPVGILQPE